jgi:hypothetical protein
MRRRDQPKRPIALLLLLLIALGSAFPYFEAIRNANERPRLMQGMALVETQSWAIDGPAMRGLDTGPDVARSPEDGRTYPNKPPGASVVAAFAFMVGKLVDAVLDRPFTLRDYTWWARMLAGLLPTLLLCLYARKRYPDLPDPAVASVGVVAYALATPAASYAHLFYGHQLAAALLFVGVTLCVDAYEHQKVRIAAIGGACAGAAVAVEYGAVFAGLPLGVMLLWGLHRRDGYKPLVAGLAGALVPIALLAAYQAAVYGSPWATGYHHASNPEFAAKHGVGLLGLTWPKLENLHTHMFSHDGGLLWWSPLAAVGVYGLADLALGNGARRTEARLHLAIFLVMALVGTGLTFQGGWRVGPRYMVITLPGLTVGFCHAFARMRGNALALGGFVALATYAVLVNAMAANLWPHLDLDNIHSPAGEVLAPLLADGFEPYGLPWLLDMAGSAWLPIAVSVFAMWWFVYRAVQATMPRVAALAAGAVLGAVAVWMLPLAFSPHPKGKRNLAYIENAYEPKPGSFQAPESHRLDTPVAAILPPGGR